MCDKIQTTCAKTAHLQLLWLLMSQSIPTGYIPPSNFRGVAQKNCPGGRDLTFESCPRAGNSTRAGICESQYETFRPCIGFISEKYSVSQKLLKMGNTTLLISSSNYAKRHINVYPGGDLCSPFFSNFSETPCVKIGFDVRISFV